MGRHVTAKGLMLSEGTFGAKTYRAYVPHPLMPHVPFQDPDPHASYSAALAIKSVTLPVSTDASLLWGLAQHESIQSSRLEQIRAPGVATGHAAWLAQMGTTQLDPDDARVLGNLRMMRHAERLGKSIHEGARITVEDVLPLHERLFDKTPDRVLGGELRDSPIWIGPPGTDISHASYVAPPPELVPDLLDDLISYINTDTDDPPLRAAVVHAQFETIHPFEDGNGRAGRALIHVVLRGSGLANCVLPISAALARDVSRYHRALNAYRYVGSPTDLQRVDALRPWMRCFADACISASAEGTRFGDRLSEITDSWEMRLRPQRGSDLSKALILLRRFPLVDRATLTRQANIEPRNARMLLRKLSSAGVLRRLGMETRGGRFEAHEIVSAYKDAQQGRFALARNTDRWVASTSQASTPADGRCTQVGPRSHKQCVLRGGHRGQHRYSR